MKESGVKEAIRDNVLWVGLLLIVAAATIFAYHREKTAPPKDAAAPLAARQPAAPVPETQTQADTTYEAPQLLPPRAEQEEARKTIADYNDRVRKNPKDPDAPAYYAAMGNLSFVKLGDPAEAARYYEVLLADYPNWDGIMRVYTQLMACYEQLNDRKNLDFTYKRMMEYFPPDSPQHQYAKLRLGR